MVAKKKAKGTILITGASRGLGYEFAKQYAADGWHVIATCRQPEKAMQLKKLVNDSDSISLFQLDVVDDKSVKRLAKTLARTPIDLLLHNSGTRGQGAYGQGRGEQSFGTHNYKVWKDVFDTNTLGRLRVMEALYKNVKAAKGIIANISSAGGSIAFAGKRTGSLAYQVSKCGLNMIVRSTAEDARKDKVTVVGICPGKTRTQKWHTVKSHPVGPAESVQSVRKTISKLRLKDTGRFMDQFGKDIPW
ncbi:MAG: SDR family oxidoreductase [Bdellovibrionales bacterium]